MKIQNAVIMGAMALALVACDDKDDNKDKPEKPQTEVKIVKYDGAVPADLSEKVKTANTVDKVDLLAAVKAGEVAKVKIGDKESRLIGGKWSTALEDGTARGLATSAEEIGKLEVKKANYKGVAMAGAGQDKGALAYTIDFATKKGQGEITGITAIGETKGVKKIVLAEAAFDGAKGTGKVTVEADRAGGKSSADSTDRTKTTPAPELSYEVGVFGPQANEIAGKIAQGKDAKAVFHGLRQEDKVGAK